MSKRIFCAMAVVGIFAAAARAVDVSTVTGNSISYDADTGVALVEGNAVVDSSTATLAADQIRLNTNTKDAVAEGNVVIRQASGTLTGTSGSYNWAASTGVINDAVGVSPPWRFSADSMSQKAPGVYFLSDGDFTSCDLLPPHFLIHAGRSKVVTGKRATLRNARLEIDHVPTFWTPIWTRSLVPKKYTLRIEPGQSSRDGITLKTTVGYPVTAHSFAKVRWDYLQRTGNGVGLEYDYYLPNINGLLDTYYIRDVNPDPQPSSRRVSLLWNHYQKLTTRLTGRAKIDYKSDQTFGNQFTSIGNNQRVENKTRGMFSETGFNYQFSKASVEAVLNRQDRFDAAVASRTFISQVTLPRVTVATIPLLWKYFPAYTSFSGSFINDTAPRSDPDRALHYQRSGNGGVQIKRDIRFTRNVTVTPRTSFTQFWQDHDFTDPTSSQDLYLSRYSGGGDARLRLSRSVDTTVGYTYTARSKQNQLGIDRNADDRGVETNQAFASLTTRVGRTTRMSLRSALDMRSAPRSFGRQYDHVSERISPPSLDVQWQATPKVTVFFSETYALFDSRTRSQTLTPLNTSGEIQYGGIADMIFFSHGFSYSKKTFGDPSRLYFTDRAKFYLSPKWHVDLFLTYYAEGESRLNYSKIRPNERTLRVVRDLHCWLLRMEFSSRPGVREASFYIDMKANLTPSRNIFREDVSGTYYPYSSTETDLKNIFPPNPAPDVPAPQ